MKYAYIFISVIVSAIASVLTVAFFKQGFVININEHSLVIGGVFLLAFLCICYVFTIAQKSADLNKPMGMPSGSVRAIIALLVIVFFMMTAMLMVFSNTTTDLGKQVLTTMATLAIAVSSFYFGSKATEQGSKISQEIFSQTMGQNSPEDVPLSVVEQAISNNKERWMKDYNCTNIYSGKKLSQQVLHDQNCIIFQVKEKKDNGPIIPAAIDFTSSGKSYKIPTDVQTKGDTASTAGQIAFQSLSTADQYKNAQTYIDENDSALKEKYPGLTGITAGPPPTAVNSDSGVVGIVLQLKEPDPATGEGPQFATQENYDIPLYFQVTGATTPHASPQYLNAGVSRVGDNEFGTFGIPVKFNNETHILSCYHVYFNQELKAGAKSASSATPIADRRLISPASQDGGQVADLVGEIVEGQLSDYLDVAVMKPTVPFEPAFNGLPGPLPYTVLTRDQQNKIYLRFWGNGNKGSRESLLISISSNQWIDYPGAAGSCLMKNLIQINKCATGGDSGAAVCDLSGNLVGIIVASDQFFTYLISAYNIEDKTTYELNLT